jgi:hypothetical protein
VKRFNPYRIAAVLLVVFCVTHTAGGMLSRKSRGQAADDVFTAMQSVHFDVMGADCTFHGFWFGFGLMVSVFLLFSALVAWQLGGATGEERPRLAPIAWGLFACQVGVAVLSWAYFFPAPGVISTMIAALVGAGCLGLGHAGAREPAKA